MAILSGKNVIVGMPLTNVLLIGSVVLGLMGLPAGGQSVFGGALELNDGDRVVFLGNSFFERAVEHGCLETAFALRYPEKQVVYRNLGWDGDTVYGHSRTFGRRRSVFGDAEAGFSIMLDHVRSLRPTLVILAYGLNESFDEAPGLARFQEGLTRLLDGITRDGAEVVLLSPPPLEDGFGASSDYIAARNQMVDRYRSVIADVAKANHHSFVDLFAHLMQRDRPFSVNGIYPNREGYRYIANIIASELGLGEAKIDPGSAVAERIRAAIVEKNRLYFHRWRPRNDAFVYGERKSEQVIAQAEPAQFEPVIERKEQGIRNLLNAALQ